MAEDGRTQDRRLDELTDELRVMIPGATVLFAFLFTLPFSTGFLERSPTVRWLFLLAFVTSGATLVMFIGVGAYHRLRGHPYDKGLLVITATRQAVTGLVLLAVCLTAVTGMVVDAVLDSTWAVVAGAGIAGLSAATWFGCRCYAGGRDGERAGAGGGGGTRRETAFRLVPRAVGGSWARHGSASQKVDVVGPTGVCAAGGPIRGAADGFPCLPRSTVKQPAAAPARRLVIEPTCRRGVPAMSVVEAGGLLDVHRKLRRAEGRLDRRPRPTRAANPGAGADDRRPAGHPMTGPALSSDQGGAR
jgi:hypothetical protein